jgi:hypothetical protein
MGKANETNINISPEINIFLFLSGEVYFFDLKGDFQIRGVPDKVFSCLL